MRVAVPRAILEQDAGGGDGRMWREVLARLESSVRLQPLEDRRRPDVVLASGHRPLPARLPAPLVAQLHEAPWDDPEQAAFFAPEFAAPMRACGLAAVAAAARVLTAANSARDELVEALGADPDRVDVVAHGVDPARFGVSGPSLVRGPYVLVDGYLTGTAGDFGIDVTHPRFQAWLAEVNAQRLDLLEPIVGTAPRALDVGCGRGELLAAATQRGWRATGVEPVAESAAAARERGLDVRTAVLEDAGLEPAAVDVVCAFHVLEHMPDAIAFLRALRAMTRSGGHVVVETPNWGSTLRRHAGAEWIQLRPLEHLVHLAPDTLDRALTRAGLVPVRMVTRAYLSPRHTLAEAAAAVGRARWAGGLGARHAPPGRAAWAAIRAAERVDDRRLRGAALFAVARVP